MDSYTTARFWKLYNDLPDDIRHAADKAYRLWRLNLNHPSLHFKRVHTRCPIWSVRITDGYRTIGTRDSNIMLWIWIGTHEEYERLLKQL